MASSYYLVVANLVLFFVIACSQDSVGPWGTYCNTGAIVPPGSPISTNIDNLLATISYATKANNAFIALASGAGKNTVFGLAQCRADLDGTNDCYPCIQDAARQIQDICGGISDAQIWYDYCLIRYSQDNFIGTFDASQNVFVRSEDDYPDPESLFSKLGPLFDEINSKAVDPANGGIPAGQVDLPNGDTLYGAGQCTLDLRPFDCARCLDAAVNKFEDFCKPKQGCRVFLSSCGVRYEIYNFAFPPDAVVKKVSAHAMEKLMEKYGFGRAKQTNKLRSRKSMMISSF